MPDDKSQVRKKRHNTNHSRDFEHEFYKTFLKIHPPLRKEALLSDTYIHGEIKDLLHFMLSNNNSFKRNPALSRNPTLKLIYFLLKRNKSKNGKGLIEKIRITLNKTKDKIKKEIANPDSEKHLFNLILFFLTQQDENYPIAKLDFFDIFPKDKEIAADLLLLILSRKKTRPSDFASQLDKLILSIPYLVFNTELVGTNFIFHTEVKKTDDVDVADHNKLVELEPIEDYEDEVTLDDFNWNRSPIKFRPPFLWGEGEDEMERTDSGSSTPKPMDNIPPVVNALPPITTSERKRKTPEYTERRKKLKADKKPAEENSVTPQAPFPIIVQEMSPVTTIPIFSPKVTFQEINNIVLVNQGSWPRLYGIEHLSLAPVILEKAHTTLITELYGAKSSYKKPSLSPNDLEKIKTKPTPYLFQLLVYRLTEFRSLYFQHKLSTQNHALDIINLLIQSFKAEKILLDEVQSCVRKLPQYSYLDGESLYSYTKLLTYISALAQTRSNSVLFQSIISKETAYTLLLVLFSKVHMKQLDRGDYPFILNELAKIVLSSNLPLFTQCAQPVLAPTPLIPQAAAQPV